MKISEIAVGGCYRSDSGRHAGVRVVDRIYLAFDSSQWLEWSDPAAQHRREGLSHGISSVALFAKWAERREPSTAAEGVAPRCPPG
jgi:hypothetical protein